MSSLQYTVPGDQLTKHRDRTAFDFCRRTKGRTDRQSAYNYQNIINKWINNQSDIVTKFGLFYISISLGINYMYTSEILRGQGRYVRYNMKYEYRCCGGE